MSSTKSSNQAMPSLPAGTDIEALRASVDDWLRHGAYISAISTPKSDRQGQPIAMPGSNNLNYLAGVQNHGWAHRFRVNTSLPGYGGRYLSGKGAAEMHFDLSYRLAFCPEEYGAAAPDKAVPATLFDPRRNQSLTQLDAVFTFDEDGQNQLRGFGRGKTYPIAANGGQRMLMGVNGIISGGSGIFEGVVGSYVVNGHFESPTQPCLQILIRLQDTAGRFLSDSDLDGPLTTSDPDPDASYMTFVGVEDPENPVETVFEDGKMVGGHVTELLKLVWLDFENGNGQGLRTRTKSGPVLAKLVTSTRFDPSSAAASAEDPFSFITQGTTITVFDTDGSTVGTIDANIDQGHGYAMRMPDPKLPLPAFEIVGFGTIDGGSGQFEGARGLFSVNSVISVMPTSLYNMYIFRFEDPEHQLRLG